MKRGNARKIWLLTYGASSTCITHSQLIDAGLRVKECYTLTQRDLKYTMIRLSVRVYVKAINDLMDELIVIPQQLPGYEKVTGITGSHGSINEHPGFQLIVKHMNENSPLLQVWMEDGDLLSNSGGLLWGFRTSLDYSRIRKRKLEEMAKEFASENKRLVAQIASLEERCDLLALENTEMGLKNERLTERNRVLKIQVRVLKANEWADKVHNEQDA
jgi:hypothetical protein